MASNNFKTSFNKGRLGIGLSKSENNGDPQYALEVNGNIKITGAILDKDGFNYAEVHELPTHLLNNGPISYPNVNDMEETFYLEEQNIVTTKDISGDTGRFLIKRDISGNTREKTRISNGMVYGSTMDIEAEKMKGDGSMYIQNGSLNINTDARKNAVFQTKYKGDYMIVQDISKSTYGNGLLTTEYLEQFDDMLSVGGHHMVIKTDPHTIVLVGQNDKGQVGKAQSGNCDLNHITFIKGNSDVTIESTTFFQGSAGTSIYDFNYAFTLTNEIIKDSFSGPDNREIIKQISCGKKHTLLLMSNDISNNKKIIPFFLGDNEFCQSGNLKDISGNIPDSEKGGLIKLKNYEFKTTSNINFLDPNGVEDISPEGANHNLLSNKDLSNVSQVAAGDYHSMLLINMPTNTDISNQILFCFGKNDSGQLGNDVSMNTQEHYTTHFANYPDYDISHTYLKLRPHFYSRFYKSKSETFTDISQVKMIKGGGDRSAVLFNDGRFFQSGGFHDSFLSDDIEDTSRNILLPYLPNHWKSYITNDTPIRKYADTLIFNDKIYLFGGVDQDDKDTNDIFYLDLTQNVLVWKKINIVEEDKPTKRRQHTITLLDSKLFLFGGQNFLDGNNEKLNDLWYMDLNATSDKYHQWEKLKNNDVTATDNVQKYAHSAVVYNNTLYIYGGKNASDTPLSDLCALNIQTINDARNDSWTKLNTTDAVAMAHHSADISGNIMYLFDNNKLYEVYLNNNNNSFSSYDHNIPSRQNHATTLVNNKLIIFGGEDPNNRTTLLNDIWSINLAQPGESKIKIADTDKNNVAKRRSGHSVVVGENDIMYVIGGDMSNNADMWSINVNPKPFLDYLDNTENEKIVKLDCGKNHTILITDKGRIFNNDIKPLYIPAVGDNSVIKAVNVKAGDDNSIIQLNTGELIQYYFGDDTDLGKAIFDNSSNEFIDICGNLNTTDISYSQIKNSFILNNIETDNEILTYGMGGIDLSSSTFLVTIKNQPDGNLSKNVRIYSDDLTLDSNTGKHFYPFYPLKGSVLNITRTSNYNFFINPATITENNNSAIINISYLYSSTGSIRTKDVSFNTPTDISSISDFNEHLTSISLGVNVSGYDTKNMLEISGCMIVGDVGDTPPTLENNHLLIKNKLLIGMEKKESSNFAVDVDGIAFSKNGYYTVSDQRFKTNIRQLKNCVSKIERLTGVEYTLKKDKSKERKHLGVIAQEVEKSLPNLVLTEKDDMKSVKYEQMIPILLEAIKELNHRVDVLNTKVKKLK